MPSFHHASRNNNGHYWSGTAGILAIQLAVLFALSMAVMLYLNWSSNAALAEFMAVGKPSASGPSHLPPSSIPVQMVKSPMACARRT